MVDGFVGAGDGAGSGSVSGLRAGACPAGRSGRLFTKSGETTSGGNPAAAAPPEKQHISSGISLSRVLNRVSRKRLPQSIKSQPDGERHGRSL
ncbi:hypothetical protein [Aromatoleum anaerobium]|uniref:hypothetical protein n=1 Tax=Aromatoleum anaerobium TaxID=182180 RepID=UPI001FF1E252|nr:hypothetical protein [Aromatoleum anaerobium]MCK0506889.1 hypothetical protein [Aromatoleum anaerobium]